MSHIRIPHMSSTGDHFIKSCRVFVLSDTTATDPPFFIAAKVSRILFAASIVLSSTENNQDMNNRSHSNQNIHHPIELD